MSPAKFKEIRERLGLTQADLAEILGLSGKQPISHIETGFRNPSPLSQAIMSVADELPEKKAKELLELIRKHVNSAKQPKKVKKNASA